MDPYYIKRVRTFCDDLHDKKIIKLHRAWDNQRYKATELLFIDFIKKCNR